MIQDLHTLLVETQVVEGKLVCGNCGHEYNIHQGIANFLLPNHLGMLCARDIMAALTGGSLENIMLFAVFKVRKRAQRVIEREYNTRAIPRIRRYSVFTVACNVKLQSSIRIRQNTVTGTPSLGVSVLQSSRQNPQSSIL